MSSDGLAQNHAEPQSGVDHFCDNRLTPGIIERAKLDDGTRKNSQRPAQCEKTLAACTKPAAMFLAKIRRAAFATFM
jgi:hypothetical protein